MVASLFNRQVVAWLAGYWWNPLHCDDEMSWTLQVGCNDDTCDAYPRLFQSCDIAHLGKIRCLLSSVDFVESCSTLSSICISSSSLIFLLSSLTPWDLHYTARRRESSSVAQKVQGSGSRVFVDSEYSQWRKRPWTLNILYLLEPNEPPKRTSTYHSEQYSQGSCGTNRFAQSIFTPSENSKILNGSYTYTRQGI